MNVKIPKYVLAEYEIKEKINRGVFVDKLPGERVLAKELGISYMTVRDAIKNLVDEGILYKVPQKGTYVNKIGVVKEKTRNIGFFLDYRIKDGISNPYYSLVFNAIEKESINNGYNLIFFSKYDNLHSSSNIMKVDGVIISFFQRMENKIKELKIPVPVVLLDNRSADESTPSVVIDNYNGVMDATNYLCSLGHKRIGYITGMLDSDGGKDRLKGYMNALEGQGIDLDHGLIYKGDYSFMSGEKGATYLLSQSKPVTAIMCANDSMAIGAIKAIKEAKLNVPDDISVMGFDDIVFASQVYPPLTTMAAPFKEIAVNSVRMLFSLIDGNELHGKHVVLPPRLIVRNSCAVYNPASLERTKITQV